MHVGLMPHQVPHLPPRAGGNLSREPGTGRRFPEQDPVLLHGGDPRADLHEPRS